MSPIPIDSLVNGGEDIHVDKKSKFNGGEATKLAYLGPPGTYGHQAAKSFAQYLPDSPSLVPCSNITSIYSDPSDYLVMPFQNTIHGGVTETLDCFISSAGSLSSSSPSSSSPKIAMQQPTTQVNGSSSSRYPRIVGSLDLPIRHCLVVEKEVERIEDIKWVRSHEQALGQSSQFLQTHLPDAKVEQWPSTAGAALSLLDPQDDEDNGAGAAICSKAVVELHPDRLKVLYEGIQAISNNFTRFLLLSRSSPPAITSPSSDIALPTTFISLDAPSDLPALLSSLPGASLVAVQTRPTPAQVSNGKSILPVSSAERYPLGLVVELAGIHEETVISVGRWLGTASFNVDTA